MVRGNLGSLFGSGAKLVSGILIPCSVKLVLRPSGTRYLELLMCLAKARLRS